MPRSFNNASVMELTPRGVSRTERSSPMTAEMSRVSGLTDCSIDTPLTMKRSSCVTSSAAGSGATGAAESAARKAGLEPNASAAKRSPERRLEAKCRGRGVNVMVM